MQLEDDRDQLIGETISAITGVGSFIEVHTKSGKTFEMYVDNSYKWGCVDEICIGIHLYKSLPSILGAEDA